MRDRVRFDIYLITYILKRALELRSNIMDKGHSKIQRKKQSSSKISSFYACLTTTYSEGVTKPIPLNVQIVLLLVSESKYS